mgnify:CR=1 FL=1
MSEEVKKAFHKVKEDILNLNSEILNTKSEISSLKKDIQSLLNLINSLKIGAYKTSFSTQNLANTPTTQQINPTSQHITPTHQHPYKPLKPQNNIVSIGNQGVPTDRQTNQQTDRHIIQHINSTQNQPKNTLNNLEKASEILASLDNLKKEIRLKFKRLTHQEMIIFSLIYSLEDQGITVDYKTLSNKTNLSESSIRDYISKISLKGIPVIKEKLNNKRVVLLISQDLKKLASLNTILKLREI